MRKATPRNKPYYSLAKVRQLCAEGKVLFEGKAADDAHYCFGWDHSDILEAIKKIKHIHFYKSEESRLSPEIMLDVYHARQIKGEDIYTHFYIDMQTDQLVINSFKELKEL